MNKNHIGIGIGILLGTITFIIIIANPSYNNYQAPFEGESCEEIDRSVFVYDMSNESDYIRSKVAWAKFTSEVELKGYCKDGKRIGGVN